MSSEESPCLTCYGTGEAVTENGPEPCPDCFGGGKALSRSTRIEWRLRQIERSCDASDREVVADLTWLVHELRRSREALLRILTLCQDAAQEDGLARDVTYEANLALSLYDPS
ncbi:MAG TPA: hypothetical protein VEK07_22435 [Polyangiaceae bacterium]|nr:hypothetical protein [Polyangiaceae bacterium]